MIVWLASYPKSGNTWVRIFISTLLYSSEKTKVDINKQHLKQFPNRSNFKNLTNNFLNLDEIAKNYISAQDIINLEKGIKFYKTHSANWKNFDKNYYFTNYENSLGVIHIVRDPRNVITSVKNHNDLDTYDEALKFMQDENKVLEDYPHLKNYAKTNIVNSWRINYRSWLSNKSFRRVTIRYEDMVKNSTQTFEKLVVFVNTLMRFDNKIDKKKLNNAIDTTNFKSLQNIENEGKFGENVYSLKDNRKIKFFYQGPENDWKKNLDESIKNKIEKNLYKEMVELKYL